jgi:Family of unknown function (DUF6308)
MSHVVSIAFPSGLSVDDPADRLRKFLTQEYDYYDAIPDSSPDEIVPLDVLVATGINAFIGVGAARIRKVHRGMVAKCNAALRALPISTDLEVMKDVGPIIDVIAPATDVESVLSAVASKVLHRKRRSTIPIIDSVLAGHCCPSRDAAVLSESYPSQARLRRALTCFLEVVRDDLQATHRELTLLQQMMMREGWQLTPLRIHDILIWTGKEPSAWYR